MPRLSWILLTTLTGLHAISSTLAVVTVRKAEPIVDISERKVAWLDYEGIAGAIEQSVEDHLKREGLSTEGYEFKWKQKRQTTTCASVEKRVDWLKMTDDQKAAYITASKCLYTKPPTGAVKNVPSYVVLLVYNHITH